MKYKFLIFIFLLVSFLSSEELAKDPKKAAYLSLICPGAGEIYNGKYIKAGIFLSSEIYFVSRLIYHNKKVNEYEPKIEDEDSETYVSDKVKYDDFYNKRNNDFWWIGITTVLSILDSYVDANLHDFDKKKKDLEIKFENNLINIKYEF